MLARARQKLVLDALVIKKRGEASALATEVPREGAPAIARRPAPSRALSP